MWKGEGGEGVRKAELGRGIAGNVGESSNQLGTTEMEGVLHKFVGEEIECTGFHVGGRLNRRGSGNKQFDGVGRTTNGESNKKRRAGRSSWSGHDLAIFYQVVKKLEKTRKRCGIWRGLSCPGVSEINVKWNGLEHSVG